MNSKEDLISVIIPVYNVKPYLRMCAQSAFSQTFRNLEIIFVDDGSTDGSGEMCDEFANADSRVRVIHQKNKGPSAARNAGIEAAKGAYLYFLDSDDVLSPVTIAHLWIACIRVKADVAIGDFSRFSGTEAPHLRKTFSNEILGTEEVLRRMLMNEGTGHQPWGKLYRRCLWNTYRFPEDKMYGEDYDVLYDVIAGASKAVAVTDALYFYRMQDGSIMHTRIGERNLTLLDTSARVTQMISEQYPALRQAAIRLEVVTCLRLLSDMLETDYHLFPEAQRRIMDTVKSYKKDFLKNPAVRKTDKLKLFALLAGRRIFYLMYRISDARGRK